MNRTVRIVTGSSCDDDILYGNFCRPTSEGRTNRSTIMLLLCFTMNKTVRIIMGSSYNDDTPYGNLCRPTSEGRTNRSTIMLLL